MYKKDLDELQKVFEDIKKEGCSFVVTLKDCGRQQLSVYKDVEIERENKKYLHLSMKYDKTEHSSSTLLDLVCAEDGEKIDEKSGYIQVTDIHIWELNSNNQGTLVYPKLEE